MNRKYKCLKRRKQIDFEYVVSEDSVSSGSSNCGD
jgi:hypothetical protein